MRSILISLLALCLAAVSYALSASGSRVLVVLDDVADKDKYTKFFGDLAAQGFTLTYSTPRSDPALIAHGELRHDHLLLLPSKLKALGPSLTPALLLDFLKAEGNILLALSSTNPTPSSIVSLLLELDIHLPPDRTSVVVDHFNYDTVSSSEAHDVLLLQHPTTLRTDVRNYFEGDGTLAFPHGVAQALGPSSPHLSPILRAPRTAYTYNPKDAEALESTEDVFASGQQLSLISSMQARNSARFTVLGSAEMLEDIWFGASVAPASSQGSKQVKTANQLFLKKVAQWTFKELGVLKVGRLEHWLEEKENYVDERNGSARVDGAEIRRKMEINPEGYRIKNDVTFTIELSEHTPDRGLTPFTLPTSDALQLEFTMLSPYHRLPLRPLSQTSNSTIFGTTFRLPDQHGIFKFQVNYKRPFLTVVDEKRHVTVRHFAHDEWPRSWEISGAWPWIVGIWATVAGWLAFVAIWLFCEPTATAKVKKVQ